jgi:hypothetical protein
LRVLNDLGTPVETSRAARTGARPALYSLTLETASAK